MALSLVWRCPDRRDVELRLHTQMRWMHVRGWRRIVVGVVFMGAVYVGVELAPEASEDDAATWAALFDKRFLTGWSLEELLNSGLAFSELYVGPGVGAFLNGVEWELERREIERQRRRERDPGRGPPLKRRTPPKR